MRVKGTKRKYNRIIALCAVIILICASYIILVEVKNKKAKHVYADLQEYVSSEILQVTEADTELETEVQDSCPIDFASLWERNQDIVGWIRIPDTQVDYPILQSAEDMDDDYYLDTTVDYASGYPGAIYMQQWNSSQFDDRNTILYGHNMKDGTMFGSLHNYENEGFLQLSPYIYVDTPSKECVYQIFACVKYSDAYLPDLYDFTSGDRTMSFVESLYMNGDATDVVDKNVSVDSTDHILTLSTCTQDSDCRYLVVGVLCEEKDYK